MKDKGVLSIDAPVSGGDVGALNGTLVIMMGGDDKSAVDKALPLMECYSIEQIYFGLSGCGHHTKMVNQIMVAKNTIGVCESLLYGYKAGLNLEQLIDLLQKGAAGSFSLKTFAPRMLTRDFDSGGMADYMIKDLGIALEESKRMNISLPGTALAHQLYMGLKAHGNEKKGMHALLLVLEQMNNTQVDKY